MVSFAKAINSTRNEDSKSFIEQVSLPRMLRTPSKDLTLLKLSSRQ